MNSASKDEREFEDEGNNNYLFIYLFIYFVLFIFVCYRCPFILLGQSLQTHFHCEYVRQTDIQQVWERGTAGEFIWDNASTGFLCG